MSADVGAASETINVMRLMMRRILTTILSAMAMPLLAAQVASAQACDQVAVVNVAASIATTQIIAAQGSKAIRVCGFSLNAGDGVRSITGTDPAANVEISETVPTNARWRLRALRASLTTDANVASRVAHLQFDDGTNLYYVAQGSQNQAAGATYPYNFGLGGANKVFVTVANDQVTLPDLVLTAGHKITTSTANRQVGDNWTAPQYIVQEWTVFKFQTGNGTTCGTNTTDASGVYTIAPTETLSVHNTDPVIVPGGAGAAVCINNLRPTTLTGTITYAIY